MGYQKNKVLFKNLFYQCADAIYLQSSANSNVDVPFINDISLSGNTCIIQGTTFSNRAGETIEVFLGTLESPQDAIRYLGSAVSDAGGEWELLSSGDGWADASFIPRGGDVLLATSTYSGETSDVSDTAIISCTPASLIVNTPAPACETDLTRPPIIQGSMGGNDVLIPRGACHGRSHEQHRSFYRHDMVGR